eukprot:scaffold59362_cov63-Phaeocystis_antarctica.AAC.2
MASTGVSSRSREAPAAASASRTAVTCGGSTSVSSSLGAVFRMVTANPNPSPDRCRVQRGEPHRRVCLCDPRSGRVKARRIAGEGHVPVAQRIRLVGEGVHGLDAWALKHRLGVGVVVAVELFDHAGFDASLAVDEHRQRRGRTGRRLRREGAAASAHEGTKRATKQGKGHCGATTNFANTAGTHNSDRPIIRLDTPGCTQ